MPGWDCHGLPIELKGKCVMMVNFVSFGPMEFSWDLLYLVWLVCQFENWASTSEPLSLNLVKVYLFLALLNVQFQLIIII